MYGDYIKYYLDYAVGIWVLVDVVKKTETTISVEEAIKCQSIIIVRCH